MTGGDIPLPTMREDLQILRAGPSYSGAPVWMIFDPVRNRYFRLTYEMFQILSLWNRSGTLSQLNARLLDHYNRQTDEEEIGAVLKLLDARHLLAQPASGSWRSLYDASRPRHSMFMRVMHGYLFFKVPLVRPERFLRATYSATAFFFDRRFLLITLIVGLLGLYLVSRQWEAFVGTFPYIFTLEGAAISLASIVFIKSVHELAHAYAARRYGCRVPTMGVAMMIMMPLLYTDVTDAWRLKSRRARLVIDCAGVISELCVAALALFLWSFLEDGPLRSAIFVLAAVSWVMSLLVNLNPFMRFDGYYILSDVIGVENLQHRAFEHMRWRLRQFLFGLDDEPAETFPPRLDLGLTVYAIATAIYRCFLYVAIALIVYHFTIKLVGVVLFIIEIGFFIVRPVWTELKIWWSLRERIKSTRRSYLSLTVLVLAGVACFIPWSTRVEAPGLMQPATFARIYPAEAGRIEMLDMRPGEAVEAGEILAELSSPALANEAELVSIEIDLAERRLARIGSDAEDLAERGVILSRLASLETEFDGLRQRRERLIVRAPFDGRITQVNPDLAVGRWVSRSEQLAYLAGEGGMVVQGYVSDEERARLAAGSEGIFVPDDLTQTGIDVVLGAIYISSVGAIDTPQLTSEFGGSLAVYRAGDDALVPTDALYIVRADVRSRTHPVRQTMSGALILEAEPQSFAARIWRQVLKVLIREAGL